MTEKPILFKPEMVTAILDGKKTQTRRVVKHIQALGEPDNWCHLVKHRAIPFERSLGDFRSYCPYGQIGDCLVMKNGTRLEITDIRVERVQDIRYHDAIAEGVDYDKNQNRIHAHWGMDVGSPVYQFKVLWDSIHCKDGHDWDKNPFVWVIGFKVMAP